MSFWWTATRNGIHVQLPIGRYISIDHAGRIDSDDAELVQRVNALSDVVLQLFAEYELVPLQGITDLQKQVRELRKDMAHVHRQIRHVQEYIAEIL
jgi:ubiquinone biosynthesis protein UbiJ